MVNPNDDPITEGEVMARRNYERFIAGLRALADWYEAHPDTPVPHQPDISIYTVKGTRKKMQRIAEMLKPCRKEYDNISGFFILSRHFGLLEARFVFERSAICTRRVVGTRIEPAKPASPEREVEIVEWDCAESVLEP